MLGQRSTISTLSKPRLNVPKSPLTQSLTPIAIVRLCLTADTYSASYVGNTLQREVVLSGFCVSLAPVLNQQVKFRILLAHVLNTRPLDVVWDAPKASVRDAKDVHCAEKTPVEGSARVALPVLNVRTLESR
jgi:hypothetical protein